MKNIEPCLCGDPACRRCFPAVTEYENGLDLPVDMEPGDACSACGGTGLIEYSDADGGNPYKVRCACGAAPETNPRQRGDDDGVEYGDPRDEMDERMRD